MQIRFDHVLKQFGDVKALDIPALTIQPGEFFSFVGRAGAGKSTALRLIAAVEAPTEGKLALGNRVLNVSDGVSPDIRIVPAESILRPGNQLYSLFDEPFIELEYPERVHGRQQLKSLHEKLGTTFVYATDNQEDALAVSDRIAVLDEGELHQVGTPDAVFDEPRTTSVASFFGSPPMNIVPGILEKDSVAVEIGPRLVQLPGVVKQTYARDVFLGIRPEHVILRTGATHGWKAVVSAVQQVEDVTTIKVTVDMGLFVAREERNLQHKVGDIVHLNLPSRDLHLFDDRGVRLDIV